MFILFSPLLVFLFIGFIFNKTNYSIFLKLIFSILFIILIDVIFRPIFGNGGNDSEGLLVINLFFWINVIIFAVTTIFYFVKSKKNYYIFATVFSILILVTYINHFWSFGMTIYQYPTENISTSKKKNIFVENLTFSKDKVKFGNDSLKIINGWIENETKLIDHGFSKEIKETDSIFWIVNLDSDFDLNSNYNTKIYHNFGDSSSIGSVPIKKSLYIKTSKNKKNEMLYFFKSGEWKRKDSIKIFRE